MGERNYKEKIEGFVHVGGNKTGNISFILIIKKYYDKDANQKYSFH